jgi:hypothetical protein
MKRPQKDQMRKRVRVYQSGDEKVVRIPRDDKLLFFSCSDVYEYLRGQGPDIAGFEVLDVSYYYNAATDDPSIDYKIRMRKV